MSVHPSKTGPLFSFQGGKYLTRKDISNVLREFLLHNPKGISSHSFRIGAASAGYPQWLIQSLGRWSSDCFRNYIRIPNSTVDSVSTSMVKQSNNIMLYDPDLVCCSRGIGGGGGGRKLVEVVKMRGHLGHVWGGSQGM